MGEEREYSKKKQKYKESLLRMVDEVGQILIVHADHVGSKQMADIRIALRGKAVILMGKNTTIRKILRERLSSNPQLERLIDLVKSNIGFVFCYDDPAVVRKIVMEYRVPAPARQGSVAPIDVSVKAGPTGLDAGNTSYFQSLGISTKIVKLQIEIQSDYQVCTTGERVTASAAHLLQKLNIRPFSYGLVTQSVYDNGSVYESSVLDLTDDDIRMKIRNGINFAAAFSRSIGYVNQSSVSHCVIEAARRVKAFQLAIEAEA